MTNPSTQIYINTSKDIFWPSLIRATGDSDDILVAPHSTHVLNKFTFMDLDKQTKYKNLQQGINFHIFSSLKSNEYNLKPDNEEA